MEKAVCPPELKGGLFTTAALTITPALPVQRMHSMELGSLCFNTQTKTMVELLGLFSLRMMILLPRGHWHACLRPTLAFLLLLFTDKIHLYRSKKVQTLSAHITSHAEGIWVGFNSPHFIVYHTCFYNVNFCFTGGWSI